MQRALIVTAVCLSGALASYGQDRDRRPDRDDYVESIPAGTRIAVRTGDPINVRDYSDGRIYNATIAEDVVGSDNRILIPRGARVELIVQNMAEHEVAIDLDSINVDGRRYMVNAEIYRQSRRADGVGANQRTGKYVGGGAVFGTILGAIAGGGKGAAIGALAGAAAGGGAEVATRGHEIHIPAESILNFHLEQPMTVSTGPDRGYDRDGVHYHTGYYDRGDGRQ